MQKSDNDVINQFATSDVFVDSSMLVGMVDTFRHLIPNIKTSVFGGKFVDNMVIGRESMQNPSCWIRKVMQVDLFLWDMCIWIYIL